MNRIVLLPLSLVLAALAVPAGAEPVVPLDLTDSRPRWIGVRFESSPPEQPGRLDDRYSPTAWAWLSPGSAAGQVRVVLPGEAVERTAMSDSNPKAGTFSDFVWTFDAHTGEVLRAETAGVVQRELDFGLFRKRVDVDIRVRVSTRDAAGFRPMRRVMGETIFDYCAEPGSNDCRIVPAQPYDAKSGYVNAVGDIEARALGITSRAFAPVGEARFFELPESEAPERLTMVRR